MCWTHSQLNPFLHLPHFLPFLPLPVGPLSDGLAFRIPPNLRSAIYCSAIRTGGVEEWDFAWQMFQQAQVISEADKLRGALTCSQTPWILQR